MIFKFPEIVNITDEFIRQYGFAAQCLCRTEKVNSFGVTAAQIRDHLYNSISGLKEHSVSLSTIHRLFQAPNKHFQSSALRKVMLMPGLV